MKRFTILVDLDGITVDGAQSWLDCIYEKTGVRATTSDITTWDLHKCHPLDQLSPEQIYGVLDEPGFMLKLKPMKGAQNYLKLLQEKGHNIYFVTARHGLAAMPDTIAWLRENLPWVNTEKQLWFGRDKYLLNGDIIIDDKAETLQQYQRAHPNARLFTIDYPYNRLDIKNVYRVPLQEAWAKFFERIEFLAQQDE